MTTTIVTDSGPVIIDAAEVIQASYQSDVTEYIVEDELPFTPHISPKSAVIRINGVLSDAAFGPNDTDTSTVIDNRILDRGVTQTNVKDSRFALLPDFLENILDKIPFNGVSTGSFTQFIKQRDPKYLVEPENKQPQANPRFTVIAPANNNIGESRRKRDYLETAWRGKQAVSLVEGGNTFLGRLGLFTDDRITTNLIIQEFTAERNNQIKSGYKVSITLKQIRTTASESIAIEVQTPAPEKADKVGGDTQSGAEQTIKSDADASQLREIFSGATGAT